MKGQVSITYPQCPNMGGATRQFVQATNGTEHPLDPANAVSTHATLGNIQDDTKQAAKARKRKREELKRNIKKAQKRQQLDKTGSDQTSGAKEDRTSPINPREPNNQEDERSSEDTDE